MSFPACCQPVNWWEGEYEGTCELRLDHPPDLHFDGMSWYDDDQRERYPDDATEEYIESVYGDPRIPMVAYVANGWPGRARIRHYRIPPELLR